MGTSDWLGRLRRTEGWDGEEILLSARVRDAGMGRGYFLSGKVD